MASSVELQRYRRSRAAFDVFFLFGAFGANALPGTVLVRALGELGMSASAARNLITRMLARGMLAAELRGRIAVYRRAGASDERFSDVAGTEAPPVWTGSFGTVVFDIPESRRYERDRLRYVLQEAGCGFLRPGVALSPDPEFALADSTATPQDCVCYTGTFTPGSLDEARRVAAASWNLDEVDAAFREVGRRMNALGEPGHGLRALRKWQALYSSLTEAIFAAPRLPPELLPSRWCQPAVMARKRGMDEAYGPIVQPYLMSITADCRGRELIEWEDWMVDILAEHGPARG